MWSFSGEEQAFLGIDAISHLWDTSEGLSVP